MQEELIQIRHEMFTLSKYCSLIILRYMIFVSLVIVAILERINMQSVKSIYIILLYLVFPTITAAFLKDRYEEKPELLLKTIQKKYHFSYLNYMAQSISFVLLMVLLAIWQWSNKMVYEEMQVIHALPSMILFFALIARFVLIPLCYFKLRMDQKDKI